MLFCPEFCPPTELEDGAAADFRLPRGADGAAADAQSRRIHPVAIGAVEIDLTAIMESTPNSTFTEARGALISI